MSLIEQLEAIRSPFLQLMVLVGFATTVSTFVVGIVVLWDAFRDLSSDPDIPRFVRED